VGVDTSRPQCEREQRDAALLRDTPTWTCATVDDIYVYLTADRNGGHPRRPSAIARRSPPPTDRADKCLHGELIDAARPTHWLMLLDARRS
jgi:hypothetical protein